MGRKERLELLVEGGKAAPDASSAPVLSTYKINIGEVFKAINEKTKDYAGIQVPVRIEIDTETKQFEIIVGTPPVSSLIKKELGIEKAAIKKNEGEVETAVVGDLKMEQVIKIAKIKMDSMLAKNLKNAVKMVLGTAISMPITVEGKPPKEVLKEVEDGKYDSLIK
jgi:large subunit ribosomal protein L11